MESPRSGGPEAGAGEWAAASAAPTPASPPVPAASAWAPAQHCSCCRGPADTQAEEEHRGFVDALRCSAAGGPGHQADSSSAAAGPEGRSPGTAPGTPAVPADAAAAAGEQWYQTATQAHSTAPPPPVQAAPAAAAPRGKPSYLALLRRVHSFVHCITGSPLLQSALLFLEGPGAHPPALPTLAAEPGGAAGAAGAAGLEWTLAQLLALWLRSGFEHARESVLLAALWVLESAHSAWRSPASVCLASYTKFLGAFSREAVLHLTRDWPASFALLKRALADEQLELLQRVGWHVRLDFASHVQPCHALLFCPSLQREGQAGTAAGPSCSAAVAEPAPALAPEVQQAWAVALRQLCAAVRERAALLKGQAGTPTVARPATPECEDEAKRSAKRTRTDGGH